MVISLVEVDQSRFRPAVFYLWDDANRMSFCDNDFIFHSRATKQSRVS
jgi:hypothetical protein